MSSGGKSPRQKGSRTERAIVRLLQERGLAAERVPLSGAAGGRYAGDVSVPVTRSVVSPPTAPPSTALPVTPSA